MKPHYLLDLCTGLGGFSYAIKDNKHFETLCTAEIDSYCKRHIEENLDLLNVGDLMNFLLPGEAHPDANLMEQDLVPCEQTGFSTFTYEEWLEGVFDIDAIVAGSPCQQVSSANTEHNQQGINGRDSGLIHPILDLVEETNPALFCLENSSQLKHRGLPLILQRLSDLNYIIEYETVTASAMGLPHYRPRLYLAAYRADTELATQDRRIFELLRRRATTNPNAKFLSPKLWDDKDALFHEALTQTPKEYYLRSKRINALGNSVIHDIPKAMFDAYSSAIERGKGRKTPTPRKEERFVGALKNGLIGKPQMDIFAANEETDKAPTRGFVINGELFSGPPDTKLNPSNRAYPTNVSTLIRKDGNNNVSPSRLNRPGKLGGLVGEIGALTNATSGGLRPEFCEAMMNYPREFSAIRPK
ncbi:DNA cytosine methyltransferase [Vibrio mediterranei]|uniref:DNA cytosine methyltransferase n=1 Tax=Vibrio mediterranei TaxID=689 RepID=UPI004069459B